VPTAKKTTSRKTRSSDVEKRERMRRLDPRATLIPYLSATDDDNHVAPLEGCAGLAFFFSL
jgi:hypothetical protein